MTQHPGSARSQHDDDVDRRLAGEASALADWICTGPSVALRAARERLAVREGATPADRAEVEAIRARVLDILRGLADVTVLLRSPPPEGIRVEALEQRIAEVERACRTADELMADARPTSVRDTP